MASLARCCALVALFVGVPIDVLLASMLAKTPGQLHAMHLGFGVLAGYSLLLDIGARGHGDIALDAIASCERLKQSRTARCQRHGYAARAICLLSPCDAPNLALVLHPGCDVRLTLLQRERQRGGDGPIFLYLDRPELLCAGLSPRNTTSENI